MDIAAFIQRFASEGSLLNLALMLIAAIFYRLFVGSQKAREDDRKTEQAARKADADATAQALSRIAESLTSVRALLDMIDRQVGRD